MSTLSSDISPVNILLVDLNKTAETWMSLRCFAKKNQETLVTRCPTLNAKEAWSTYWHKGVNTYATDCFKSKKLHFKEYCSVDQNKKQQIHSLCFSWFKPTKHHVWNTTEAGIDNDGTSGNTFGANVLNCWLNTLCCVEYQHKTPCLVIHLSSNTNKSTQKQHFIYIDIQELILIQQDALKWQHRHL